MRETTAISLVARVLGGRRGLFVPIAALAVLAGCGVSNEEVPGDETGTVPEVELELPDQADLPEVGDCWGLKGEPGTVVIPCDQPHVYEVYGVNPDLRLDDFEDSLEGRTEYSDLIKDFCDGNQESGTGGEFLAYFGFPFYDQPFEPPVIHTNNQAWYRFGDGVVCSAYNGPGVTLDRSEVTGSFSDRGVIP